MRLARGLHTLAGALLLLGLSSTTSCSSISAFDSAAEKRKAAVGPPVPSLGGGLPPSLDLLESSARKSSSVILRSVGGRASWESQMPLINGRQFPILHIVVRNDGPVPASFAATIHAKRRAWSPRRERQPSREEDWDVNVAFGFWGVGSTRDIWLDLGSAPEGPLFDGFETDVTGLTISFLGPNKIQLEHLTLWPRTWSTRLCVASTRLRYFASLSWTSLSIILAGVLSVIAGITASRGRREQDCARRSPAHSIIMAVLIAWCPLLCLSMARLLTDVRRDVHDRGGLSLGDLHNLWVKHLDPEFPSLLTKGTALLPEDASLYIHMKKASRWAQNNARYFLFPRRHVDAADANYDVHLGWVDVPTIVRPPNGQWLTMRRGVGVGGQFPISSNGAYVIAVDVPISADDVAAPGSLELRVYATGKLRKVRAVATNDRGDGRFLLSPPLHLPETNAAFQVSCAGGDDCGIRIGLADGEDAWSSAAFVVRMSPAGHAPVGPFGEASYVFKATHDGL